MADSVSFGSESREFVVKSTDGVLPIPWWLIALGIGAGAVIVSVVVTRK